MLKRKAYRTSEIAQITETTPYEVLRVSDLFGIECERTDGNHRLWPFEDAEKLVEAIHLHKSGGDLEMLKARINRETVAA